MHKAITFFKNARKITIIRRYESAKVRLNQLSIMEK